MHELINFAKENSFVVIGLLVVALYLQDRIDSESTSIRRDMAAYQLETTEQIGRIETLLERRLGQFEASIEHRLGEFESSIEHRFGEFETSIERRLGEFESRLTGIGTRLDQSEGRLSRIETLIEEMVRAEQH